MKGIGFRFGEAISDFAAEPRPDAVWTIMACGAFTKNLAKREGLPSFPRFLKELFCKGALDLQPLLLKLTAPSTTTKGRHGLRQETAGRIYQKNLQ